MECPRSCSLVMKLLSYLTWCQNCAQWRGQRRSILLPTLRQTGWWKDQLYLTHMLVKTTDKGGQDWDTTLPYVLFTFCCSMQSYTMKSLFFLLYWHDPRLPTETALTAPIPRAEIDIVTYKKKVVQGYTKTWGLAQSHVCKTQDRIRAILNREDSIDWLPTT